MSTMFSILGKGIFIDSVSNIIFKNKTKINNVAAILK